MEALTLVNYTSSTWPDSRFHAYYYLAQMVVKQPPSSWPDILSAQRHSLLCPMLPFSCTHAIVTEPDVYYCDSCYVLCHHRLVIVNDIDPTRK